MAAALDEAFAAGMAAVDAQDYAAAERFFRGIVALRPESHQAWNALAWTSLWQGQPDIGIEYARRATELERGNAEYLNTLGVAQGELGELAAAEASFRKALKIRPGFVGGLINLAKVLLKEGRLQETIRAYERAHAIDPAFPRLRYALAQMYRKAGQVERAKALMELAERSADDEELAMALAEIDSELEGVSVASERLRRRTERHPEWRLARTTLAHLALSSGDWREGWRNFLLRIDGRDPASFRAEPLAARLEGRRVLLRGEQGIGDVLFYLRFVPLLRARGALVSLACERRIAALASGSGVFEAVREPSADDGRAAGFDYRIWLGDLPALLEADEVPPAWPLVCPESARTRAAARLAQLGAGPYLAVTWRAGTDILRGREFGTDRRLLMKELPAAELGAALRGWRGTVLALQRNLVPAELAAFSAALGAPAHDLSTLGEDLNELLGVLSSLDEYAALSNTNMHLLAGLGRTARVLVPYPAEWRWMRAEGPSPWFPGFAVYREPRQRGWKAPLEQLRRDLIG